MDTCIFCQILEGKLPAQIIYEDKETLAFLSIQPIRAGHTLIIPKIHEPHIFSLPEDTYLAIMKTAYKLASILQEAYKPKRIGLLVAGWDIPHAHLHLVPMHEPKDLTSKRLLDGTALQVDNQDLEEDKKRIVESLAKRTKE